MTYELWDTETANMVGDYPNEQAALQAVRDTAAQSGDARVLTWALAREDRRGRTTTLVVGHELLARARRVSKAVAG